MIKNMDCSKISALRCLSQYFLENNENPEQFNTNNGEMVQTEYRTSSPQNIL